MIDRDELEETARRATAAAVAAALPMVGGGAESAMAMDRAAARAIEPYLEALAAQVGLEIVGAEGPRDGVDSIAIDRRPGDGEAELFVYCDPIDGTTTASLGGPRSVSVLAIGDEPRAPWQARLPDSTAVFAAGSHRFDVERAFEDGAAVEDVMSALLDGSEPRLGTLNRPDNRRLLDGHDRVGPAMREGSEQHGRRTVEGETWIAVADTTVLLPLECTAEIGRLGLVESQIQSALYPHWAGMIVSRDLIVDFPGGAASYLDGYLGHRRTDPVGAVRLYFSEREIAAFVASGIPLADICTPLTPGNFGAGRGAAIAMACLRTNADPKLAAKTVALRDPRPTYTDSPDVLVDVLSTAGGSMNRSNSIVSREDAR